jgi:AraC-like DNA-binding protein
MHYKLIIVFCLFCSNVNLASEVKPSNDIAHFNLLKKKAGSSKKYFKLIRNEMAAYYSQTNTKSIAATLDRVTYNSSQLDAKPTDFVIHALAVTSFMMHQNEFLKMAPLIHKMEKKMKLVSDKNLLVFAEQALGTYYQFSRDYKKALAHDFEALRLAKVVKDTLNYQTIYYSISGIYYQTSNYQASEEWLNKAIYYEQFGFTEDHYGLMMAKAILLENYNDRIHDALFIYLELKDQVAEEDKAVFYNNLGRSYLENDQLLKSEEALLISEKKAIISRTDMLNTVYANLSDCYLKKQNYERSFHYLKLKDSVLTAQNKDESIAELEKLKQEDFDIIQSLQKKNASVILEREKIKTMRLLSLFVFVVILFSGSILFVFRLRLKNKALVKMGLDKMKNSSLIDTVPTVKDSVYKISTPIIDKLEILFNEKELFKDSDLTIQKLAKKLGTNSNDLSQTINGHYGKAFRTLINEKRIELAKHMLINEKYRNYSMVGIAETVGYASKSSFYTHFKELTGVTPSNFQSIAFNLASSAHQD